MDIIIVAQYSTPWDIENNGRFTEIAYDLIKKGHQVEIVTTDFSHGFKQHIALPNIKFPYKITLLHESGYKKNISFKRFYSNYIFGKNIKKYLRKRKKPDVIYCAVPSLAAPYEVAKYCKKNHIRLIIDVQDLWPEAFKMVFNMPIIDQLVFTPFKFMADYIYAAADDLVAVSDTYLNRALRVNKKCQAGLSVYLGTNLSKFDHLKKNKVILEKPKEELWLAYVGTLGHSYDIIGILDAMKILMDRGIYNFKAIIMGTGPLQEDFERHAQKLQVPAIFTGKLPYGEMVSLLCQCDIAVNPIKSGSAASIINKVGDYAAAGLPVVNTQESPEYIELLQKNKIGIHCPAGNVVAIADAIQQLFESPSLRAMMGKNNRALAENKFDRKKTYVSIVRMIEKRGDIE